MKEFVIFDENWLLQEMLCYSGAQITQEPKHKTINAGIQEIVCILNKLLILPQ